MTWSDLTHPEDLGADLVLFQRVMSGNIDSYSIDKRFIQKGGGVIYASLSVQCLRHKDGLVDHFVAMVQDITERKRAEVEKEKLEAQNRQLQKSESLGRMAGAIAHHFNNQLMAVMMNLQMAMETLPRHEASADNLAEAMLSARKAAEVSSRMLTYLGQTDAKRAALDLSDACRLGLSLLRAIVPQNVVLNADLPGPGPVIDGNASQIQQILTNLATNAWESCGGRRGAIHLTVVTVSAIDIPAAIRFPIDYRIQHTAYACLEVADSGSGIPDNDIEKLFEPFFSTKFTGRGLGLPVVLGIVRAHQGLITVESQLGSGSVFRVFLPVLAEPPQKPIAASHASRPADCGTMLLVEDEPVLRKVVAAAIKGLGFTVLEAQDGSEAVEIFKQHCDEIRVVLCDLTMPRMDGWETLAALRQLAPGIPFILSSGYGEAQTMEGSHPERPQAFLSKPYEFEALGEALYRALEGGQECPLK
jgi:signal transduction histidine kinase/ActR/RegA family two-component response regulator